MNETQHYAQTLYYPCREMVKSDSSLARILAHITQRKVSVWISWIHADLFRINDYHTESKMMEEFVEVCSCMFVLGYKQYGLKKEDWLF